MTPLETPFVLDTEFWIIASNFMLVGVTALSIREEHKTIRSINRANSRLLAKVISLVTGKPVKKGKHERKGN